MKTSYQTPAKPKPPTRYREQRGAEQKARWMRLHGRKAYVYQCRDCKLAAGITHRLTWTDPDTGERYGWRTNPGTIEAWHVGIDTGAPHHVNRRSHYIPEYKWDRDAQDWLPW